MSPRPQDVEPFRYTFAAQDLLAGDSVETMTKAVTLQDLIAGPVKNMLVGLGFAEDVVWNTMLDVAEERTRADAMKEEAGG
jgi:hypothetical protein